MRAQGFTSIQKTSQPTYHPPGTVPGAPQKAHVGTNGTALTDTGSRVFLGGNSTLGSSHAAVTLASPWAAVAQVDTGNSAARRCFRAAAAEAGKRVMSSWSSRGLEEPTSDPPTPCPSSHPLKGAERSLGGRQACVTTHTDCSRETERCLLRGGKATAN